MQTPLRVWHVPVSGGPGGGVWTNVSRPAGVDRGKSESAAVSEPDGRHGRRAVKAEDRQTGKDGMAEASTGRQRLLLKAGRLEMAGVSKDGPNS